MSPESKDEDYDFIVTGFGCAGMSFLYYLLNSSLKQSRVLVIDNSEKKENDRTWCYWAAEPLDIHPKNVPLISWEKIRISNGNTRITKELNPLKYYHLKSSDFYQEMRKLVGNHANVKFIKDQVGSIEHDGQGKVKVETKSHGKISAKKVLNSIFFQNDIFQKKQILSQHFVGWEVETSADCFEPDTAILMDFLKDSEEQTSFFYILPFTKRSALIEYTEFSEKSVDFESMEGKIKSFMRDFFKAIQTEITFKESGSIPMTTQTFLTGELQNVINIGTLAGCTKPSTGYTFVNIQKHCEEVVRQLEKSGSHEKFSWKFKRRHNFYDNIFLNIAKKWPNKLPNVFINLFEVNRAADVFRFLGAETSFWEELKILSKLKFPIFLKSLYNYEKH